MAKISIVGKLDKQTNKQKIKVTVKLIDLWENKLIDLLLTISLGRLQLTIFLQILNLYEVKFEPSKPKISLKSKLYKNFLDKQLGIVNKSYWAQWLGPKTVLSLTDGQFLFCCLPDLFHWVVGWRWINVCVGVWRVGIRVRLETISVQLKGVLGMSWAWQW